MKMDQETILLKNGNTCVLRSVEPEDAGRMISYMKIMLGETPYLLRTPEEFDYSVEGEAEVLRRRRDDPRALMILAEIDGEIIATSDVMSMGVKSRTLHRATLGMSVRQDYWRQGIGSAMMERLIAFAKQTGYEQIELTVEVDAEIAEPESLAEKISFICRQKGWKTSLVGFCLREGDVVTFQTEVSNVPEKEISALVKSWAVAQAGVDAAFSFTKVGTELWMETLTRSKVEEFSAAFKKFGLNLRGLSVMPANLLEKIHPYDRTEFITEIVRDKKSPNLLSARGSVWNWKKISSAVAAIFFISLIIGSIKLFFDYYEASNKLDAAKISVEGLHADLALKENLDANIAELHKLNNRAAQIDSNKNFKLLINIGKISDDDIRLTKIRVEENFLELEGITDKPALLD